jgi:hypothetical protein
MVWTKEGRNFASKSWKWQWEVKKREKNYHNLRKKKRKKEKKERKVKICMIRWIESSMNEREKTQKENFDEEREKT